MPKITQQRKHATKPTVIKVTKVCTICTDKKPTAIHRCTTCKTSPTCFKCVKDWIVGDGGIVDSTGKFVYSCPTCRAHLNISATMVQDSDVKTKLYYYFLHEVENCNVDNARNMLLHFVVAHVSRLFARRIEKNKFVFTHTYQRMAAMFSIMPISYKIETECFKSFQIAEISPQIGHVSSMYQFSRC